MTEPNPQSPGIVYPGVLVLESRLLVAVESRRKTQIWECRCLTQNPLGDSANESVGAVVEPSKLFALGFAILRVGYQAILGQARIFLRKRWYRMCKSRTLWHRL